MPVRKVRRRNTGLRNLEYTYTSSRNKFFGRNNIFPPNLALPTAANSPPVAAPLTTAVPRSPNCYAPHSDHGDSPGHRALPCPRQWRWRNGERYQDFTCTKYSGIKLYQRSGRVLGLYGQSFTYTIRKLRSIRRLRETPYIRSNIPRTYCCRTLFHLLYNNHPPSPPTISQNRGNHSGVRKRTTSEHRMSQPGRRNFSPTGAL